MCLLKFGIAVLTCGFEVQSCGRIDNRETDMSTRSSRGGQTPEARNPIVTGPAGCSGGNCQRQLVGAASGNSWCKLEVSHRLTAVRQTLIIAAKNATSDRNPKHH